MYETLIRPHEVSQVSALPSVASVSERIKQSERKREDKRLRQMAAARAKHAEKRKRGDVEQEEVEADVRASDMKKAKTDDGVDAAASGFDQDLFYPRARFCISAVYQRTHQRASCVVRYTSDYPRRRASDSWRAANGRVAGCSGSPRPYLLSDFWPLALSCYSACSSGNEREWTRGRTFGYIDTSVRSHLRD